ncbi:MAG: hypothetical protein Q9217_004779 [Psora testacea]
MRWLDNGFPTLKLDIVGFLAILGEASVTANAQVSLLSLFSLLPRLLPAPQALIRTERPLTLPSSPGKVIGAHSGGIRPFVHHIAGLVHSREPLPAYHVRCERITKPDPKAHVSASLWGPIIWAELLGTAMSLALLILSIIRSDGFALLATILLSLLTSMIGFGSRWSLHLMKRKADRPVPKDNIVLCYPNGAFRIIKCNEDIARELYWHPEACNYVFNDTMYRLISLLGTITLMFGVICLGNSTVPLQIAFAAAYMILNAVYWVVAALPSRWHWDLSCYKVTPEEYEHGEANESFTQALWKAIAITQSVDWVKNGQVAPVSEGWERWVDMAGDTACREMERAAVYSTVDDDLKDAKPPIRSLPDWNPEQALTACLNPTEAERHV